jgi:hypothetical protein
VRLPSRFGSVSSEATTSLNHLFIDRSQPPSLRHLTSPNENEPAVRFLPYIVFRGAQFRTTEPSERMSWAPSQHLTAHHSFLPQPRSALLAPTASGGW